MPFEIKVLRREINEQVIDIIERVYIYYQMLGSRPNKRTIGKNCRLWLAEKLELGDVRKLRALTPEQCDKAKHILLNIHWKDYEGWMN